LRTPIAALLIAFLALVPPTRASQPSDPAAACLRAAAEAEQRWDLPENLLRAIGEVETGRRDPSTGGILPWPWSIDVSGTGYVFASEQAARAAVAFFRARGFSSIDIGCFQVNLQWHPRAFASIAEGFDPAVNADYAARFLRELFARSGSWERAVEEYHSTDPARGTPYRTAVLRVWRGGMDGGIAQVVAGDPHVILITPVAASIPVYTPQTLPDRLRATLGLGRIRWHRSFFRRFWLH
jgi:hypothetical protein